MEKEARKIKLRFQDHTMQAHYEALIKDGYHWKTAESKTLKRFEEYDNSTGGVEE